MPVRGAPGDAPSDRRLPAVGFHLAGPRLPWWCFRTRHLVRDGDHPSGCQPTRRLYHLYGSAATRTAPPAPRMRVVARCSAAPSSRGLEPSSQV